MTSCYFGAFFTPLSPLSCFVMIPGALDGRGGGGMTRVDLKKQHDDVDQQYVISSPDVLFHPTRLSYIVEHWSNSITYIRML